MQTILVVGAFDTKGAEYAFLIERIKAAGYNVLSMDTGVMGQPNGVTPDVTSSEVAEAGGADLETIKAANDRGKAMAVMTTGAETLAAGMIEAGLIDAAIGMGGTGGTTVVCGALRALPFGMPKMCISTAASGNTAPYIGIKDIVMVPSIVDVAGLNRISVNVFAKAVAALDGMLRCPPVPQMSERPIIGASMFGNTTDCINMCAEQLDKKGYEVMVFHCTGTGGKTMESLVDDGLIDAVLDLTTTEWADTLTGGVFDAGDTRLDAPGRRGIPHLIAPGCIDMANFGTIDTVPQHYKDAGRQLYEWNPSVTLMRTNKEENTKMGEIFAQKANAATGPIAILIPLRGVSILDGDGERFCDREADAAMFDTLKAGLRDDIPVHEIDCNINDSAFAAKAVEIMIELIAKKEQTA